MIGAKRRGHNNEKRKKSAFKLLLHAYVALSGSAVHHGAIKVYEPSSQPRLIQPNWTVVSHAVFLFSSLLLTHTTCLSEHSPGHRETGNDK